MYTLNDTKDFNDRPNNRYTFTYASNQDVDILEDKVEDVQGSNIPLEGGKIPSNYLPTNTVQTGTDGKISSEVLPTNVVTLGDDGLISSNQLPGFVDDVVEVETLPDSGETGKIYIVTSGENVNKQYRWSGSQFVELTSGNIVIGEVTGTAYDGGKGKNLESSLNNHVADTNVHVTTSEKELWNNKLDFTALNDYALKTEIPDVSNFATTEQVSEVEAKMPTDYVTSVELEEEINIVESQIPNDYASEDELAAVEAKIPDISNLATKTEVEEVASNIPTDFITHEELNNSISPLATTEALNTVEAKIPTDYITSSQLDEVEDKIPSVSSWALTDNEETIPAAKLPSFVDDIVEVNQLPETGESGKIYLLIEGEQTTQYRWSGTQFVRIDHDGLVIGTATGTALDGKIGTNHINNSDIHVTTTDKETWNNKIDESALEPYALKTDIPDVSDFVDTATLTSTVSEINNSINKKIETGTADFTTREEVQSELAKIEEKIPSIDGLASETYVDGKITEVEGKIPSLDDYAKTSDIPDVSEFVTEKTLTSTIQAETAATDKKIEIAVSGLATTTEVQSSLAEVEEKIPDISDLAKQSDSLSYNMGDFETLAAASLKAADNQFYNNPDRRILHFSVNNTDLGMILNVMGSMQGGYPYKSRQYLYYGNHIYTRYISRGATIGNVSYTQWIQNDNVTFAGKGVRSDLLFDLTSESTVEDVKAALTYPNGDGVLTEDDLEACTEKGMFLNDYTTGKPVMVGLHRIGPYYTFTLVENNIVKEIGIASDYTVQAAPNNAEYLRSDWNKLPVETKIPIWTSINGVKSATTILGWFGCKTVEELRDKIKDSSLVSMLYLNSADMFYRIPIEFIELKNSDNQIHLVTVGVDMSDDSPTRYEITANLDGTVIENGSNVKVVKEGLLPTAIFDEYKKQMFGDIDVDKYIENTAYSAQFLAKLEQSYIDDLGNPDNIDGKPYDSTTNKYVIGQPYLTWAYFDDTFTFHYDLYSKLHCGFFGDTLMSILGTSFTTNHMDGNKASAITSLETSADNNAIIEKINELISVLKERGVTL